jgi:hypothetical protein
MTFAMVFRPSKVKHLQGSEGAYCSRVCTRKCALTEGGGDSLPIRGVFSHLGVWKFAFWVLRHKREVTEVTSWLLRSLPGYCCHFLVTEVTSCTTVLPTTTRLRPNDLSFLPKCALVHFTSCIWLEYGNSISYSSIHANINQMLFTMVGSGEWVHTSRGRRDRWDLASDPQYVVGVTTTAPCLLYYCPSARCLKGWASNQKVDVPLSKALNPDLLLGCRTTLADHVKQHISVHLSGACDNLLLFLNT